MRRGTACRLVAGGHRKLASGAARFRYRPLRFPFPAKRFDYGSRATAWSKEAEPRGGPPLELDSPDSSDMRALTFPRHPAGVRRAFEGPCGEPLVTESGAIIGGCGGRR